MTSLTRTTLIARSDLRRRIRNRSAVITAFAAPLGLAVVFSVLIGGAGGPSLRIGVLDLDGSTISGAVATSLLDAGSDSLAFESLPDDRAARVALDDSDVGAVIVLTDGFGSGAAASPAGAITEPARIEVRQSADAVISAQVARSVADAIAADFERSSLTAALAASTGSPPPLGERIAAPLALVDEPAGGSEVDPGAYFGASMSILFLFFTIGFASRSIHSERRDGTLPRMLSTPATPTEVLAGKTLSVSVLGLCGFLVVWAVTSSMFSAPWGPPVAVFALIVATVIAVGGVAAFVASLARTERQADTATSVVAFAFALLGGNFISPGAAPELLRRLSLLTPNGWALQAFTALNADAANLSDIAATIGVLIAFGIVFGGVGLSRAARRMIP